MGSIIAFIFLKAIAQPPTEHLSTNWPAEDKWKIVKQHDDSIKSVIMFIPGKEKISSATIIGSIVAYKGMRQSTLNDLISFYKSEMDTGSRLTIIEKSDSLPNFWAIFKIETPKTDKYPEPESDLYYVIQGDFAVFENHVAIRKPALSEDFVLKWSKIFKYSTLAKD
jgi:hypothetical protein